MKEVYTTSIPNCLSCKNTIKKTSKKSENFSNANEVKIMNSSNNYEHSEPKPNERQ